MRITRPLYQSVASLTLFTRVNCSLCDTAKSAISQARKTREVDYEEIDVMADGQRAWRDLYEFDTPVLHVQNNRGKTNALSEAKKLFHRFSTEDVQRAIDEANL